MKRSFRFLPILLAPLLAFAVHAAQAEIAEVIAAIRAGAAYVNVHTTPLTTSGEIRGQIRASARR